jgi:hypothetical protein
MPRPQKDFGQNKSYHFSDEIDAKPLYAQKECR